MRDLYDFATAEKAVADPATPAADLTVIAQAHASLRTQVVFHPNVDPDLLDWLDDLSDPNLSWAVAARRAADAQPTPNAAASVPPPAEMPLDDSAGRAVHSPSGMATSDANERASRRTRRKATWGSIIAAIAFFTGAVLIWIGVSRTMGYYFCYTQYHYLYPWNWAYGFDFYLCIARLPYPQMLNVISFVEILAFVGCGVVCLVIGRRNIKRAVFLSGIILGAVSVLCTIAAVFCIPMMFKYGGSLLETCFNVFFSVLFLTLPIVLAFMARGTSETLAQRQRAVFLIIVGTLIPGVALFGTITRLNVFYGGGLFRELPALLYMNIGNIPFFIGLFALMLALPNPPRVRNRPLFVASALSIAEGVIFLLFVIAITRNILQWNSIINASGPPYTSFTVRFGFSVIYFFIGGVYIVFVGVYGLVKVLGQSTSRLIVGLGIGLIAIQVVWALSGYVPYRIYYMPIFLVVSTVYLVGAMTLRNNARSENLLSGGVAPQSVEREDSAVPGRTFP